MTTIYVQGLYNKWGYSVSAFNEEGKVFFEEAYGNHKRDSHQQAPLDSVWALSEEEIRQDCQEVVDDVVEELKKKHPRVISIGIERMEEDWGEES